MRVHQLATFIIGELLFLILLLGSPMWAQRIVRPYTSADKQARYPKYVAFLPSDKLDSVLVYANTDIVPVVYKVNKYRLQSNAQLDSIVSLINRVILDSDVQLAYVWIGGSASPEGPLRWNKKLGEYRSSALAQYLLSHSHITSNQLRVENLVEDWYSVSCKLQTLDFPHKEKILNIISSESDWEKRKQRIKQIDGGVTWWKLIREIFPPYRNGRILIVCNAGFNRISLKPTPPLSPLQIPVPRMENTMFARSLPMKTRENRFYAIKTNTVFLAALCANIGFEAELWRHWSLDLPVWYSPYDIRKPDRKIRLLATQPELRWWPHKAGEGFFMGPHAHLAGFNIALNDHGRYQDPNRALWGFGVGLGYAFNLGVKKKWAVEMNLGAGYANYVYDSYNNWKNGDKFESCTHEHYWGITRVGINVAYKWYRPRKRWKTAK